MIMELRARGLHDDGPKSNGPSAAHGPGHCSPHYNEAIGRRTQEQSKNPHLHSIAKKHGRRAEYNIIFLIADWRDYKLDRIELRLLPQLKTRIPLSYTVFSTGAYLIGTHVFVRVHSIVFQRATCINTPQFSAFSPQIPRTRYALRRQCCYANGQGSANAARQQRYAVQHIEWEHDVHCVDRHKMDGHLKAYLPPYVGLLAWCGSARNISIYLVGLLVVFTWASSLMFFSLVVYIVHYDYPETVRSIDRDRLPGRRGSTRICAAAEQRLCLRLLCPTTVWR
jgi:hypothetical protein